MVEVCRPFLESGQIQLFCVDSVDSQSWLNHDAPPGSTCPAPQ
ncbi:esterase/lipase superfamily enzyme [Heliophilum fasciatum]|nr:esterase/lipase superfamily enzyme [Heliophilum fasciatum]